MKKLSAPVRRALEAQNIRTEKDLSQYSVKEILSWHGVGRAAIPHIKEALAAQGLPLHTEQ